MGASVKESPDLREAWMLLFQGKLKQAAPVFQKILAETDDAGAGAGLLLCAAVMGAGDAAAALLADRDARKGDAALVLWRAAWICAVNGSGEGLSRLTAALERFPSGGREQAVLRYAAGHLSMMAGDEDAAVRHFLAARQHFDADPEWFLRPRDETLTNVFIQTRHMLPQQVLAELAASLAAPPAIVPVGPPCVAVAADGKYLRRFGPDFVKSLEDSNPGTDLVVLAVDAGPEDLAGLADAGPGLSVDIQQEKAGFPGVNRPAVYASWRFLALQRLLAGLRRPVLVLDIDLLITAPLAPLFAAMEGADFGCWYRPDGGPGGIVRAGATGFAATANAWWMAALTAAYIRARFAEEAENLWFVDQTALWRAAHAAKKNRPGFRPVDFTQAGSFTDFFALVGEGDAVKQR